jgi:sterol desaturase/sphingolipid hydroxylase (fatty acid hydroxylase superfamily)
LVRPRLTQGFERVKVGKSKGLEVGDFFHQLHHRFFDCNYGTDETRWDERFGTFHDGTDAGNKWMEERRSKIWLNPS